MKSAARVSERAAARGWRRAKRINRAHGVGGAAVVLHQYLRRVGMPVFGRPCVSAVRAHFLKAPAATAVTLADDIQENAVCIREELDRFPNEITQIIQIRGVEAEGFESCLDGTLVPAAIRAVGGDLPPLRVFLGYAAADTCGDVDRNVYIDFLRGIELGP